MNLSDARTRIADDTNTQVTITTVANRLTREINRVCSEMWDGFRWSFRLRNYRIVTDVDVTAGTLTLTNGSRSITGSGTAFSSSHVGWHIYFPADSTRNWYKIRTYASSTSVELDVPYQGTSGGSKAYILRHFDYLFPTESWDIGSVIATSQNRPLEIIEPSSMDLILPTPVSSGYPSAISIHGSDSMPTVYSTGTVSGTIDTNTLTGVGTAWLNNIFPGDIVALGGYSYTVRSVESDTSILLYNKQQITSTTATYTITRQFGRFVRVLWPSTTSYTIDIRALRKYSDLVNGSDSNELLYRYPNAVILKVSALELKRQNDMGAQVMEKDAEMAILRAKAEDESMTSRSNVAPIFSYRQSNSSSRCV